MVRRSLRLTASPSLPGSYAAQRLRWLFSQKVDVTTFRHNLRDKATLHTVHRAMRWVIRSPIPMRITYLSMACASCARWPGSFVRPLYALMLCCLLGCAASPRWAPTPSMRTPHRSLQALATSTKQSPGELLALRQFLSHTESLVPTRILETWTQPMWVQLDGRDTPLAPPPCPDDAAAAHVETELGSLDWQGPHGGLLIRLHQGFARALLAGPDNSPSLRCGHGSLYALAQATLLHEILHAYDVRVRLSNDPRFLSLQRFVPQGPTGRLASRNHLTTRLPDPYALASPQESLAVHGEYFLLDPTYRCRIPASYQFLVDHLGHTPFARTDCQTQWTVYDGTEALDLDPARVYAVHYLWASAGDGIASRFGHAMLRIVICHPSRATPSEACLADVQDHLVLSFAANLEAALQISPWRGLVGAYRSQLYIRRLTDVLLEYNERELRDLYSYPLRLSGNEVQALVEHAVALYWSYAGSYYFLTNNCGTETAGLLRAALREGDMGDLSALTPRGIRDRLLSLGLAEVGALDRVEQQQAGYFFPSMAGNLERAYKRLRQQPGLTLPASLNGYVSGQSAAQRRSLFATVRDPQGIGTLLSLEQLALHTQERSVEAALIRMYLAAERSGTHAELRAEVQRALRRGELFAPWRWLRQGYGIPLLNEAIEIPDGLDARHLVTLRARLATLTERELPQSAHELRQIEANQAWLLAQIISWPHPPSQQPFQGRKEPSP